MLSDSPSTKLVAVGTIRLRCLRLQLLLNFQERLGALVIHQPFTLGLFVERQNGQTRNTAVASSLLQEPLGTGDTDLTERPVGFRGETLQFKGGLQAFGVRAADEVERRSEQLFKAVLEDEPVSFGYGLVTRRTYRVYVGKTHDGTVRLSSQDGWQHEVGETAQGQESGYED